MKKYLKIAALPILFIFIFPLILSIINLFNITIPAFIYLISILIITFLTGYTFGLISIKKAFINGFIVGIIFVISFFLMSLILKADLNLYTFIYYLLVIFSSTLGSMFSNIKKDK